MIREIRITGLGVIDEAVLEFDEGLNVVTGETGAGKTMVVQSLALLLGGRADPALVRTGARQAVVEGIAELPDGHPALIRAQEAGADVEDDLILSRSVAAAGRSRAVVGGRSAPAAVLAQISEHLVAVHGQADQWRLQRLDQHRVMLDEFGGPQVAAALAAYAETHARWRAARQELQDLHERARERAQRLDQLTASLEEIEAVDPVAGEDDELAAQAARLQHVDALREAAAAASSALVGHEEIDDAPQAMAPLAAARSSLAGAGEHDPRLAELATRLGEVTVLVTDVAGELSSYLADLDVEPGRLESVLSRRAQLSTLTRKYGATVAEVVEWAGRAAAEVAGLTGADDRIEQLTAEVAQLDARVEEQAGALTQAREAAGRRLGERVTQELAHLAMGSARVEVEVRRRPDDARYAAHGQDEVEILMAANAGAPLRGVAKAASGGELSRLMLALEVATGSGGVPTFVFDEVDAGVGGAAGLDVGSRLKELARHAQVIVVTHLAQVAAYADRHLVVRKAETGEVTSSGVVTVAGPDREAEIARMLGGNADSDAARAHAVDLLEQAGLAR